MSDNSGAIDPTTGHAGNASTGAPYEVAPEHAHDRLDTKDQRSLANNIADAARVEAKEEKADNEANVHQSDPTALARSHGNKDKELIDDEEEELRKKDEAKEQSRAAHAHGHHH